MARTIQRTLSQDFIVTNGDAITGDDGTGADGGDLVLEGGAATSSSNGNGGDVVIRPGDPDGSGARGVVNITNAGGADSVPILQLTAMGSNGEDVRVHVGDRNPSGNVSGNPGDLYIRHSGATSALYVNTGSGDGTTTWTAASGGGGSSLGYFSPRAAPDSPNASDEEFNDTSSVNNMTTFDPGSLGVTKTLSENRIAVLVPNSSSAQNVGVIKAVPSGDWTVWTRVSMTGQIPPGGASQFATFGLSVLDSNAISSPTTADIWKLSMAWRPVTNSGEITVQRWAAYNSFSSNDFTSSFWYNASHLWCRIRYDVSPATISFDISTDGEGWQQLYTTTSLFFTPAFVGLIGHVESATALDSIMYGDFLRFTTSHNYDQVMLGKVV